MAQKIRHRTTHKPKAKTLDGRCIAIGAQGDGVIKTAEGIAYAPYTVPGDKGTFDVIKDKATLLSLTNEGDHRQSPTCAHYGDCGGCQLQHVTNDYYTTWKHDQVRHALERAELDSSVLQDIVTTPIASRRRAVFAVQKASGKTVLGFNKRRSSQITLIPNCIVLEPVLLASLPILEALATAVPADAFDLAVTACQNGIDVDIRSRRLRQTPHDSLVSFSQTVTALVKRTSIIRVSLNGEPLITMEDPVIEFGEATITPPPGGFLQASVEGEQHLARLVLDGLGFETDDLRTPLKEKQGQTTDLPKRRKVRRVADLFCGAGAFALRLATHTNVYAADSNGPALDALRQGVVRAGNAIKPIKVEARNLDERPLLTDDLKPFDAVVFDPPRAGAAAQARALAQSQVPTIIGVSCNPSTFARDAQLLSQGGYSLEQVTPVDQFVYTSHIELVAVFRRS